MKIYSVIFASIFFAIQATAQGLLPCQFVTDCDADCDTSTIVASRFFETAPNGYFFQGSGDFFMSPFYTGESKIGNVMLGDGDENFVEILNMIIIFEDGNYNIYLTEYSLCWIITKEKGTGVSVRQAIDMRKLQSFVKSGRPVQTFLGATAID